MSVHNINTLLWTLNQHVITWVVPVSWAEVHFAYPLDCDCTDYTAEVSKLGGLQRWEDLWQDLKCRDKWLDMPAKNKTKQQFISDQNVQRNTNVVKTATMELITLWLFSSSKHRCCNHSLKNICCRLHTEILCQCRNEGPSISRLRVHFYLAQWTSRAGVLWHHSVITHMSQHSRFTTSVVWWRQRQNLCDV